MTKFENSGCRTALKVAVGLTMIFAQVCFTLWCSGGSDQVGNWESFHRIYIFSEKKNREGFQARTLSEEVRTVLYNADGEAVTLTLEEVKRGKRLFNVACASCHVGGLTKTNPNVGLDIASLNSSVPPRNNISSLVEFLKSPKSYDGFQSISEIHPGIESCDIFPKMRTLTREDLVAISGHILLQTKILNERWGGGKIYY